MRVAVCCGKILRERAESGKTRTSPPPVQLLPAAQAARFSELIHLRISAKASAAQAGQYPWLTFSGSSHFLGSTQPPSWRIFLHTQH
ncbi:MAG TPA: hypothetical protein PKY35_14350 [Candidatus Hydrogenedentes bacterium]|nr:hypothetical protein [Candidatus Hydrogenedentota bacterium]HOL78201.1 hypothetical protein [Candidatus Hydrogenedentota bacterium]HPO87216.1 hypothetical protein [Candidatus Hydrogenedentota bacterium]